MAAVTLREVTKTFERADRAALHALSLAVEDGEFLVLLGPSGCGKTTALRCIAGLEEVTAGEIRIGDRAVTHVPPADRDVAMVFQNYALYPHLSVRGNIAFPLEMRRVPRVDITRRVADAAWSPARSRFRCPRRCLPVTCRSGCGRSMWPSSARVRDRATRWCG